MRSFLATSHSDFDARCFVTTRDLEHAIRLQTQAAESRCWRLDLQIEGLRSQVESLRRELDRQQQSLLFLVGSLVLTGFCLFLAFIK